MQNPGPNTRVCINCGNYVMDGMAKIITPPLSKSSDNSQRAACPQCGGELTWNLSHNQEGEPNA
jgi:DNA-directed RNA polymerase subunit RPC12/RpoP